MQDKIQTHYAVLCQNLGNLQYKKNQIDRQIDEVNKQLEALNFINALIPPEIKPVPSTGNEQN